MICVCDRKTLSGESPASLLDGRSGCICRVVRSTLAVEACAADAGIEHGMFLNCCLSKMICSVPATKGEGSYDHFHASDCKASTTASSRTLLLWKRGARCSTSRAIRQSMSAWNMRWVPTHAQKADALTEDSLSLCQAFTSWMRRPTLRLRE